VSRAAWRPASTTRSARLGIAVGVAALGALVPAEAALGGGSPLAYVDGYREALLAGAGLAAAGAVATAFLIGSRRAVPAAA
jgi:hypothetical protein